MSDIDLKTNLDIAKEAAKLAGDYLVDKKRSQDSISQDLLHDIKLKEDVESENMIVDFLSQKTSFSILSEEGGLVKDDYQEYCWHVDPIDGTLNYLRYIPLCCVSIGLWQGDMPLLGVIYDFNRDEMYSGISHEGAWLNGNDIRVSPTDSKEKAVLCTGFPSSADHSSVAIKDFIKQVQDYKKVRLIGSAALSLAYVACGKLDAYYERDIMLWDIAGGIPIISGAGGKIWIEKSGKKENCFNLFAGNDRFDQDSIPESLGDLVIDIH